MSAIENHYASLVDVALDIAREETQLMEQMREALLANDAERALGFAKRLCGIEDESHAA